MIARQLIDGECSLRAAPFDAQRAYGRQDVDRWVIVHWFELSTLVLLCLNLWFVSSVLNVLRQTNHWLAFLSRVRWDEAHGPDRPNER